MVGQFLERDLRRTAVVYHGGPISRDQVVSAIRSCFDPEIPLNVYDLGLIYDIAIKPERVDIKMTLTALGCPIRRANGVPAAWNRRRAG